MTPTQEFAQWLHDQRVLLKVSQDEVARAAANVLGPKFTRIQVLRIEKGERGIELSEAHALIGAMDSLRARRLREVTESGFNTPRVRVPA